MPPAVNQTTATADPSRETFVDHMKMLAGAYHTNFSVDAMRAYHLVLGKLTVEQMTVAFERAMALPEKYCPTPGRILALAPMLNSSRSTTKIESPTPSKPWTDAEKEKARAFFVRIGNIVTLKPLSQEEQTNQQGDRNGR